MRDGCVRQGADRRIVMEQGSLNGGKRRYLTLIPLGSSQLAAFAFDNNAPALIKLEKQIPPDRKPNMNMRTLELTLQLPDQLAREAEAKGLLKPEAIEHLLRQEIRRRQADGLFEAADRLASLDLPSLTTTEVEAEIEAVRRERRDGHENRR